MSGRVYKARRSGHISQKDADVIGPYLDEKFGDHVVTPQAFVAAAQNPKAVIHGYLEWDDSKAANDHRVWQAREILGSLMVIVETPEGPAETRAYHNVVIENGERVQAYAPQHVVWQSETLREQVVSRALRELMAWETRYAQYEELAAAAAAIREVLETAA